MHMTTNYVITRLLCVAFVVLPMTATTAIGQEPSPQSRVMYSGGAQNGVQVDISDGAVFLNGKAISFSKLPKDLDLNGISQSYYFFGDSTPIFDIKGRFFVIENETLREASEEDMDQGIILLSDYPVDNRNPLFIELSNELNTRARRLKELGKNVPYPETEQSDLAGYIGQIQINAEEAAHLASQLPAVDMQAYLTNVKSADASLYENMVREYRMEAQAKNLALAIRRTNSKEEIKTLTAELRETLGVIFDLKQDNRREEIDQLNSQLIELKRKVGEREELREKIIEKRIQQLINLD